MSEEEKIISYLQFCAESYKMTTQEKDEDNPFFVAIKVIRKQQDKIKDLERIKQQKLDKYLYKNQWICKDLAENYIHKPKIKEITELYKNSKKELVVLPNGKCICLSDCAELIEYLQELLGERK